MIRKIVIDLVYDIIGSVLFAVGLYTFALNAQFAPEEVSGLSIIVHKVDPKAMIVITDAGEVYGEGFLEPKEI